MLSSLPASVKLLFLFGTLAVLDMIAVHILSGGGLAVTSYSFLAYYQNTRLPSTVKIKPILFSLGAISEKVCLHSGGRKNNFLLKTDF